GRGKEIGGAHGANVPRRPACPQGRDNVLAVTISARFTVRQAAGEALYSEGEAGRGRGRSPTRSGPEGSSRNGMDPGRGQSLHHKRRKRMTEAPQPYRVLARKYRPGTFAEMIGQDAMVRTLRNAIASQRLAHAFILT